MSNAIGSFEHIDRLGMNVGATRHVALSSHTVCVQCYMQVVSTGIRSCCEYCCWVVVVLSMVLVMFERTPFIAILTCLKFGTWLQPLQLDAKGGVTS